MSDQDTKICQECGATVYSEHLDTGIAGYQGGKLLCPHCLEEAEARADRDSAGSTGQSYDDLEAIGLVDEEPASGEKGATQIRSFGSESQVGGSFDEAGLDRQPDAAATTATRCRTFHAKLNEGAVAFMNRQVNEWADSNPNITIKFATSTIGVFEGKKADPHLILTVFY